MNRNDELMSYINGLREDLGRLEERVYELAEAVESHAENAPHLYPDGSSS